MVTKITAEERALDGISAARNRRTCDSVDPPTAMLADARTLRRVTWDMSVFPKEIVPEYHIKILRFHFAVHSNLTSISPRNSLWPVDGSDRLDVRIGRFRSTPCQATVRRQNGSQSPGSAGGARRGRRQTGLRLCRL